MPGLHPSLGAVGRGAAYAIVSLGAFKPHYHFLSLFETLFYALPHPDQQTTLEQSNVVIFIGIIREAPESLHWHLICL